LAGHLPDPLANYRQRWLDPSELLAIDDRVAACSLCRELLLDETTLNRGALLSLQASLETARPMDEHLSSDALRAYVEVRLGEADRELAEGHLEICILCQAQAERLLASGQRRE
jgi:hypothetical protein